MNDNIKYLSSVNDTLMNDLSSTNEIVNKKDQDIFTLDNQIKEMNDTITYISSANDTLMIDLSSKNTILHKKEKLINSIKEKIEEINIQYIQLSTNLYNLPTICENTIFIVYQYKYANNIDVTGIGDFIRGCFYVLQLMDKYKINIKFIINNHPIKKHLQYFLDKNDLSKEIEDNVYFFKEINHKNLISNNCIEYQYISIDDKFFDFLKRIPNLNGNKYMYLINHPKEENISEFHKMYLKKLFQPTAYINLLVDLALSNLELEKGNFTVIHVRLDDNSFKYNNNEQLNDTFIKNVNYICGFLNKSIENYNKKTDILLISNNINIKLLLLSKLPTIKSIIHEVGHVADASINDDDSKLINTLKEFFIMSHASNIYSFSVYEHGSGFSKWCAKMYDIPYKCMKLQ